MNICKKVILITLMIIICSGTIFYGFAPGRTDSTPLQKKEAPPADKTRAEIWQVVLNMNYCRLEGDTKDLADYLHTNVLAIMPTTGERLHGREACIAAWTEFSRAVVFEYQTKSDKKIDIYNNTAVVTYYHDMVYIKDNRTIHAFHRDMVVLIKENGKWYVVAFHSSPFPKK